MKQLQSSDLRQSLSRKCAELSDTSGGAEVAQLLLDLAAKTKKTHWLKQLFRLMATQAIHKATYLYRVIRPQKKSANVDNTSALFSAEIDADFLRAHIRGTQRFEQLIPGASSVYIKRRHEIARDAYGK